MKKRILSLLLVVLMFASAIPVASTYASENADELSVWLVDDAGMEQPAADVALFRGGAVRLAAHRGADVSGDIRWQIASGDEWINIQNATADTLRVSYGMVASLLVDGTARLRCTVGEFESEAVAIRVTEENPAPAEPGEPAAAPELLPAPEATVVEATPMPEPEPTPEPEPIPETEAGAPDGEYAAAALSLGEDGVATPLEGDNAASEPTDETTDIYKVTIEYKYSDDSSFAGQRVAPAYIAEYAADVQTGTLTVPSPVYMGYTASQTSVAVALPLTQDENITVTYSPAEVTFSVRHFKQNVNDDQYTLEEITVTNGQTEKSTGEYHTSAARDYPGFEPLAHAPVAIANDGSTTIDIYYDRVYSLIGFELDGGYGVEPVYARYGAPISVGTPTKAGYTFSHWVDASDNRVELPATMPESGGTYKAVWTPDESVKITVVYWLQDADTATAYHYWTAATLTAQPGSTKNATEYWDYAQWLDTAALGAMDTYEKRYSTYNAAKTAATGDVTVAGDGSTILNVYYDRKEYTLKFYYAAHDTANDVYKVYGGSTYVFGNHYTQGTDNSDEKNILNAVYTGDRSSQWGKVGNTAPELNTEGKERQERGDYTLGRDTDVTANTEFLYLSFTARYGEDISELWPCNVFAPAERTDKSDNPKNEWTGKAAFVSAWNGEHHVYYSKKNSNETIKGNYMKLDYQLLWDYETFGDSQEVAYLCFWENGCDADFEWNVPKLFRYNLWVPVVDNAAPDGATTKNYNGVDYYLLKTYDTCDDSEDKKSQTPPAISGYTHSVSEIANLDLDEIEKKQYQKGFTVDFYYTRNEYDLTFINGDRKIDGSRKMPYGKKVWSYYQESIAKKLTYYEEALADIYKFEGWYSDPNFLEKYDLNENTTMPPNNGTLYAHWVPKSYTVTVLADKGAETALATQQVSYNGYATAPTPGDREGASFIGWFYEDAGVEHAFSFEGTRIVGDITVYAKWRNEKSKTVVVSFVTKDEAGNVTQIADTTRAALRVGQTHTFEVKTGTALYAAYRTGYFPQNASHSITVEENPTDGQNGYDAATDSYYYEFEYVYHDFVPYTVEYYLIDLSGAERPAFYKDTDGKAVFCGYSETWNASYTEFKAEHNDNNKAIVTEVYTPAQSDLADTGWTLPDGYVPDALRQQLVVIPGKTNTIRFVYRYEKDAARYVVNHWVEDIDGGGDYTLYDWSEDVGTIGNPVSATPMTISGYRFDKAKTQQSLSTGVTLGDDNTMQGAILAGNKLELNFYYSANEYPYRVLYLEKDTRRQLVEAKTTDADGKLLKAKYGATVTETALTAADSNELKNYRLDGATTQSITIAQEASEETAVLNTIIFYYVRQSGGLCISKQVKLDEEQAKEENILDLPTEVEQHEFTFTVYYKDGLPKSVYDAVVTEKDANGNDRQTSRKLTADAQTITVNLHSGQSVTIEDLPLGEYTVTETNVPGFQTQVGGENGDRATVSLDQEDKTGKVEFVNYYPFYTGNLELSKAVVKADENDPAASGYYQVHVTLDPAAETRMVARTITWEYPGDSLPENAATEFTVPARAEGETAAETLEFDVYVPVDGTITLKGVPAGDFTVTEKAKTGVVTDYYMVSYSKTEKQSVNASGTAATVSGVIHGGHVTQVAFTNTCKKGDLTIQKTVEQAYEKDSFQSGTFAFNVTGYSELPAGTYSVNDGAYTATVAANGSVALDKAVTIEVNKTDGQTSWSDSATLTNLPAGHYTVTETVPGGYTCRQTDAKVSALQVGGESAQTAAFVNEFKRTSGNLTVSKTIVLTENETGVTINADKEFEFTLLLKDGSLAESYQTTDNQTLTKQTVDGKDALTFALKHGKSVTINGLPVGEYELREKSETGYECSFDAGLESLDYCAKTVTVETNQTAQVECVNRYPVYDAHLKVSKTVVTPNGYSAIDQAPSDDRFTFEVVIQNYDTTLNLSAFVSGVFYAANGTELAAQPQIARQALDGEKYKLTFTLMGGQYVDLKLPVCEFSVAETDMSSTVNTDNQLAKHYETSLRLLDSGNQPYDGPALDAYALDSGATVTAEFTNTYKRHYADLTIVTRANYADQNFIFDVASVTDSSFKMQVILKANDRRTIKDLPVGQYTVTEQDAWSWRENALTAQSVDPAGAGTAAYPSPVTLQDENVTVTFAYGDAERTKWLSGYSYDIGKEG